MPTPLLCAQPLAVALLLDAAHGLAYLHHEVGLVHGDVKSRNLLVFEGHEGLEEAEEEEEGQQAGAEQRRRLHVKWCDFGIR